MRKLSFSLAAPFGAFFLTLVVSTIALMAFGSSPTEAYGAVGKLAAPWIGDPTTTTYAASADGPTGRLTGILEVSEIVDGGCRRQ